MSNVKVNISILFNEMNEEVEKILRDSHNSNQATATLLDYVPEKIAMAAEGYMIDLYQSLSEKTLSEDIFQDATNANKFYALQLRQKISTAYRFDVKDLQEYIEGKSFDEINKLYTNVAIGVGGALVGGVLLGLLSGTVVHIPVVGIIAGAILTGLVSYGVSLNSSNTKKKDYSNAVRSFMADLEEELNEWVDGVIAFYEKNVNDLKATL